MATSRKIVKVFLASPGDLQDERRAAKHVADVFNKQWADNLGAHIELVGWEDTVSRFGRPQELINRDLDQCELFIGVMWKKWGTPPIKDGKYTSGFEEEFKRSIESRRKTGRPELSLLFKTIDPELIKDPGEDLKKVLTFKEGIIAERLVLFQEFNSPLEFDDQIRGCITNYVQTLQREEAERQSSEKAVSSDSAGGNEAEPSAAFGPFGAEGANFLRGVLDGRDLAVEPISAVEVARFRLLSSVAMATGNDEDSLGVHDANILYSVRESLDLGTVEKVALADTGIESFEQHNVPLWYWLDQLSGTIGGDLTILTMFGAMSRRIGALAAMRIVAEPIKPIKQFGDHRKILYDRGQIVGSWLKKEADAQLRIAALEYLSSCGIASDLPAIKSEFERGNYQTVGPATDAIIRINLRKSRENALEAIYDLQPESIDQKLVDEVLNHSNSFDTALLLPGATHRSPQVRRAVLPVLFEREELPLEIAEKLLGDSDAMVRYFALRTIVASGKEISKEQAKTTLVKQGLHSGFGILAGPARDEKGEKVYSRFIKREISVGKSRNIGTTGRGTTGVRIRPRCAFCYGL